MCLLSCAFAGAATPTFLHTHDEDIVNAQGEKVLLRGVGLGNWMLPEGYMWKFGKEGDRPRRIEKIVSDLIGPENAARFWSEYRKNYITETDIRRIAELGYNSVRPALNARLFLTESEPAALVPAGFELLDNLVKWCHDNGIYVIIDMHGAPGGQTGQNIDDSANDKPELFMEPKNQDRLVKLWTAIADRYKDEPAVAGYDLLNEPLPERTGAAARFKSQLEPLYKRLTRAIRKVDAKHMIILEGADWANDWSVFSGPFDRNLVYQFHYYCWDTPSELKDISKFLNYRKRFDVPVWVGETGERDNAIYWGTTDYLEANNIGWSFWPWKKMDASNAPYSIRPPQGWDAVVAYSRGGSKPSKEVAMKIFNELLANIRLENCVCFPEVVNAMLRRAPARIEGENYGHGGQGISYSVKDAAQHSRFYRLEEPVPINSRASGRRRSGQYITLQTTEWTAYTIQSESAEDSSVTLRVRAENSPAEAQLVVGDRVLDVDLPQTTWREIKLPGVPLSRGANHLKWIVRRGTVDLDWLDIRVPEKTRQAADLEPIITPHVELR